jgi:hypothetical protein
MTVKRGGWMSEVISNPRVPENIKPAVTNVAPQRNSTIVKLLEYIGWYNTPIKTKVMIVGAALLAISSTFSTFFSLGLFWQDRREYLYENHLLKTKLMASSLKKVLIDSASPEAFSTELQPPDAMQNKFSLPRLPGKNEVFVGRDESGKTTQVWRDEDGELFRSDFNYTPKMCPPEAGLCYLVAANGIFLGSSLPALVSENTYRERELFLEAIKGGLRSGFRFISVPSTNQEVAVSYIQIEGTNVFMFTETSTSGLLAAAQEFVKNMFLSSAIFLVLSLLVLGKVLASVLVPMDLLRSSFARARTGKFDPPIVHRNNDEFSPVIDDANSMFAELAQREKELRLANQNLANALQFAASTGMHEPLEEILTKACRQIADALGDANECSVAAIPEKGFSEKTGWSKFKPLFLSADTRESNARTKAIERIADSNIARSANEVILVDTNLFVPIFSGSGDKHLTLVFLLHFDPKSLTPANRHFIVTMATTLSRILDALFTKNKA